ncbi:MAG: hypothetical protein PHV34_24570 [Verrucomicrobiae bacterium]|nr:hypothetical protein [Verrucomicrobiae bacterium]
MKTDFDQTEKALGQLAQQATSGNVPKAKEPWGGAKVVIDFSARGYRAPGDCHVVTRHALELSWLVEEMQKAFKGLITFQNKFEFYGRLALAANCHLEIQADADLQPLLLTVIGEGYQILAEMRQGAFQHLIVTTNNVLAVDLANGLDLS